MATISSLGIGSGIDANTIVQQLVALERQPITRLKEQATKYDAQLSSFGRVQSALDSLRSAARTLSDTSTWNATTAASADAAVSATASAGTSPGAYAVQVHNLAASQMVATSAVANSATPVGQGTLRIQSGSWNADQSAFTAKSGSSEVEISIAAGDTLAQIRDKINNTSGLDVRASIVNDASGSRLVLQSRTTGAENGFRVQVSDDDGNDGDNTGLSRLAFDPAAGTTAAALTQAGRNASATINGLVVESASNTLTDVVDGVSLTLNKVTNTSTVDVTIGRDTGAMRKAVDSFVSAYNDLNKLLRDQTKYDATTKTAGTLQGDRTAISILNQVRQAMSGSTSASTAFGRLSDLGLQIQTDGSIKTTGSKLDAAIANTTEISKFFTAGGSTPGNTGMAVQLRQLADSLLGTDGAISTRQEGLRSLKTANGKSQTAMEERVALTEKRLLAQYQALDTNMAKLSTLQNFVSNWTA